MKLVVSGENLNEQWMLCFNVAMSVSWVVTCVCAALYLANVPTRTKIQIEKKQAISNDFLQCIGIIECNHVNTAFRIAFWRLDKWSKCHRCWSSILVRMECARRKSCILRVVLRECVTIFTRNEVVPRFLALSRHRAGFLIAINWIKQPWRRVHYNLQCISVRRTCAINLNETSFDRKTNR